MIATFTNKDEAITLSDSIHTFLQKNCKGYNAIRWQIPIENKNGSFSVKLPREYDTSLYKTIALIILVIIIFILYLSVYYRNQC